MDSESAMSGSVILTLNSGSSSLKFSVYERAEKAERCLLQGRQERIGSNDGRFHAVDGTGAELADEAASFSNHAGALDLILHRLPSLVPNPIDAVGHRVVQGGPHHLAPERVTPSLLKELRKLCPLDPPHLPAALDAMEAAAKLWPKLPQVACFDTSFHRTLPRVAQMLPLPRALTEETGLMRYGFHGLSCEYIAGELKHVAGDEVAQGRVIIAHRGNGASMTALRGGKSVETTMGFTPAGGLVMGSRPGDLDPGVLAYLLREGKVAPDALNDFIYQQSGLKGVSGLSADLRDLMKARNTHVPAQEAIDLFCYQARKSIGALVAVLDGVDTIVFTGGIGENAALPRASICEGLRHLGVEIEARANDDNLDMISAPSSRVTVRVMKTNEELVIARHTARLALNQQNSATPSTP
jgi:acetate kinase